MEEQQRSDHAHIVWHDGLRLRHVRMHFDDTQSRYAGFAVIESYTNIYRHVGSGVACSKNQLATRRANVNR